MKRFALLALVSGLALLTGCADAGPASDGDSGDKVANSGADLQSGKADMWGPQDDPELFSTELTYALADIPEDGAAANTPWTANYWPTYHDSINHRWAGDEVLSPAEKYGLAFGIPELGDRVSRLYGIDAYADRTECTDDEACNKDLGEKCSKRLGAESGRCIPTWWGICHAWAPGSILEVEPVHPVTIHGVTFTVNDIKALITLLYDKTDVKFLSKRCDADDAQDEIELDEYGNPTGEDIACKDTNPGTLFVTVGNLIGIRGESFVEDRTYDDEVWNQPLAGYRIVKQDEVTGQQANELLGVAPLVGEGGANHAADGAVDKDAWFEAGSFTVPAGAHVEVTMSGEADPDLYVRYGAAPTLEAYDCRPWTAGADEVCVLDAVEAETEVFVAVYGYEKSEAVDLQIAIVAPGSGVPEVYAFNDQAKQLYEVRMLLDYIGESPASLDGNLSGQIQTYTFTDTYDFVLELDADAKVIGGEWVGASKKAHPDFLWLPLSRKAVATAEGAISYTVAKMLLTQSVSGQPSTMEPVVDYQAATAVKGQWKHFGPFEVTSGQLEVAVTGAEGDVDLYVRRNAQPTKSKHDCRPYLNGSKEYCQLEGAGTWYVSVFGYAAGDFELFTAYGRVVEIDTPDEPADPGTPDEPVDPPVEPELPVHLDVTGHVDQGQMQIYELTVTAGQAVLIRSFADADVDLYARFGQAPTTVSYDKRAYTYSGNETITYTPTADGTLLIGVHGYEASDFALETSDQ